MSDPRQEALGLRARHDEEPSHSDHVALLARQIFASLRGPLRLTARDGMLLQGAALLHDIGWSLTPDGRAHHKHSARLILEHAWQSLDRREAAVVAQVARYHRKALPCAAHARYHALSAADRKKVRLLGGILRVADALDRTHTGRVVSARGELRSTGATIFVRPSGDWEAERAMFAVKRDLLAKALGKDVMCEEEAAATVGADPS